MTFDEMHSAVQQAENSLRTADRVVAKFAYLLSGRLRNEDISTWVLVKLKRELRDFNIHTGRWKE